MQKIKRRDFLKMVAVAVVWPKRLMPRSESYALIRIGLKPEFTLGTQRIVRNAEGHIIESYRYCRCVKAREFIGQGQAVTFDEQSLAYPMKMSTVK